MKNNKIARMSFVVVCMMLLSLLGGGTSIAKEPGPDQDPLATMTIEAGVIFWEAQAENGGLSLTIAGPGDFYLQQEYESGARPTFAPVDSAGNPLPDGNYTYELRFLPVMGKALSRDDEAQRDVAAMKDAGKALVQSGSFSILSGGFVIPGVAEITEDEKLAKLLSPDEVIYDDLIVDGSLCVGNDCYSGYSFGFDTIVLMENNLRIYFDDTSTIQNYPRNDWRIICNDSTDGGGNYFAIEDATEVSNILVLEAGAPDNSLHVDSYGDVGINTSTPYYELHIVDGDSPCVRLDQDGSYGWTPQKWDLCGNESNFFIRDATHASKLPFRIEPEAPTDSIFIKSNGYVGMGTSSPAANLHIEGSATGTTQVAAGLAGGNDWISFFANDTFGPAIHWEGSSANDLRFGPSTDISGAGFSEKMRITGAGNVGIGKTNPTHLLDVGTSGAYCNGGAWVDGSSREYKTNVEGLTSEEAMAVVKDLIPIKFNYKTDLEEQYLGFIAEDVPDLVATNDREGLSSMDIVAVLTKVVQEQQKIIEELEARLAALEKAVGTNGSP
jgi:hypothetical protein